MSFNTTIDNLIYSQTTQPENIAEKPFVSKEWTNPIFDTNTSASYNSNQIIFDTTTLANSGQMPNYAEGMIILPVVIRVSCTNNNDWTANARAGTDFMLALKNSHVQIVHSIGINMNNMDIIQPVPLSNAYLTFIQHSELSTEDELLNSPLHGYCKDSSSSWSYVADNPDNSFAGDSRGVGLCNNSNFGLVQGLAVNDTYNEGMFRRQKLINKYSADKILILGDEAKNSTECKSFVSNKTDGKYYFYDVVLRLKDLSPHFFPNFPLTTGVKFKITLTLNNNVSFQFSKNANGAFVFNPATFSNVSSATNPMMIASSYNPVIAQTGSTIGVTAAANPAVSVNTITQGTYQFNLTDASTNSAIIPCGSSCLACVDADVYTVSMKLGSNNGQQHVRAQCILYVPSYRLSPKYEAEYFSKDRRIRKVHYTELEYNSFYCDGNKSFNFEISSTCVRPKRLIMIPVLTSDANENINPLSSPFTTEPATTSPYILTAFNCSIANNNIYPNDINFSYDNFLQALNGSTGVNANLVNGLVSSRINLTDYQNNYHYIVCDLSRRLPEFDMVSVSIRVRGQVQSPKRLEFHCFIEKEKVIEVDTMTGALISRS